MPPPGHVPVIVVASLDGDTVSRLDRHLLGCAMVHQVMDPIGLLDEIRSCNPDVIVIDFRSPAIQLATIAALSSDLPKGAAVLLWGATEESQLDVFDVAESNAVWKACDAELTEAAVAGLCLDLLEQH